jgi:hypothetical protein
MSVPTGYPIPTTSADGISLVSDKVVIRSAMNPNDKLASVVNTTGSGPATPRRFRAERPNRPIARLRRIEQTGPRDRDL